MCNQYNEQTMLKYPHADFNVRCINFAIYWWLLKSFVSIIYMYVLFLLCVHCLYWADLLRQLSLCPWKLTLVHLILFIYRQFLYKDFSDNLDTRKNVRRRSLRHPKTFLLRLWCQDHKQAWPNGWRCVHAVIIITILALPILPIPNVSHLHWNKTFVFYEVIRKSFKNIILLTALLWQEI